MRRDPIRKPGLTQLLWRRERSNDKGYCWVLSQLPSCRASFVSSLATDTSVRQSTVNTKHQLERHI